MRLTNCYLTLAEFKATVYPNAESGDTADDEVIKRVIENISRSLDRLWEGRHYYSRTATRVYGALTADLVVVDDLLSVTTLKTDSTGARTYDTTWATTDYDLEPFDAVTSAPPRPYTRIVPTPNGTYKFPSTRGGVQVVGSFGYFDVKRTASATLAEALDTSETDLDVSEGSEFSPGMTILIDSEQMHVQESSTDGTLTVTRGANGTTAAAHNSGAAIQIYEYPTVNEAAMILVGRIFKRKDAPFGVIGSVEMGQMLVIAKHDPDVRLLMEPFRKLSI